MSPDSPKTGQETDDKCDVSLARSTREMGNVNIYDIYTDVCLNGNNSVHNQGATLLKSLAGSASAFSPMAQALHSLHTVY